MFKWIMFFSLLLSYGNVEAHQPDLSSTLLVEQEENKWVLQIRAALTAFEYEVHQHYGKNAYATPEEFQELVIKHLQENIIVQFNEGDGIVLQNGLVKLGHETSVTFEVVGTPEIIQSLAVKNKSFSDISRNQSALILIKRGFAKDQFTLNKKNEHTVKLKLSNSKFELVSPTQERKSYSLWISIGIGLILTILYFVFRSKNKQIDELTPVVSNI